MFGAQTTPPPPVYSRAGGAGCKLFVGQLPYMAGDAEIHTVFTTYGVVTDLHLMRKPDGSSKGSAFVKYGTPAEAELAIQMLNGNYTMPGGNAPLVVKLADDNGGGGAASMANTGYTQAPHPPGPSQHPENKLFVGSLPPQASELNVMMHFAKFGAVQELFLMKQPDGTSKGSAFVKYASKEEADNVIAQCNGQMFPGGQKAMVVQYAEESSGQKRKFEGGFA